MSVLSAIATGVTLFGILLVGVGLYRRDPGAQRRARRAWGWFAYRVLRRRQPATGSAAIHVVVTGKAEGMTPPLKAKPELRLWSASLA